MHKSIHYWGNTVNYSVVGVWKWSRQSMGAPSSWQAHPSQYELFQQLELLLSSCFKRRSPAGVNECFQSSRSKKNSKALNSHLDFSQHPSSDNHKLHPKTTVSFSAAWLSNGRAGCKKPIPTGLPRARRPSKCIDAAVVAVEEHGGTRNGTSGVLAGLTRDSSYCLPSLALKEHLRNVGPERDNRRNPVRAREEFTVISLKKERRRGTCVSWVPAVCCLYVGVDEAPLCQKHTRNGSRLLFGCLVHHLMKCLKFPSGQTLASLM